MIRLLVSGTRSATVAHQPVILRAIKETLGGEYVMAELVHGAAPGVDTLAAELAQRWGWAVKPVPAQWAECDLTVPADLGGCPDWPHRKRHRRTWAEWARRAGDKVSRGADWTAVPDPPDRTEINEINGRNAA